MWWVWRWLPLVVALTITTGLPVPDDITDTSTKLIGSSVVTSVSVVMGNEDGMSEKMDALKATEDLPASTVDMLKPDGFQFYTVDEKGQLITRQMTDDEIQSIIAAGGGPFPMEMQDPQKMGESMTGEMKVADVVQNVQNVLKGELSKPQIAMGTMPTIPGHANDEWSSILPAILGGESDSAPVTLTEGDDKLEDEMIKENVSAGGSPVIFEKLPIPEMPGMKIKETERPAAGPEKLKPTNEIVKNDEVAKIEEVQKIEDAKKPTKTEGTEPQETPERPMIQIPVITAESVHSTTKNHSMLEEKPVYQILNTISVEEVKDKNDQTPQEVRPADKGPEKTETVVLPVKESSVSSSGTVSDTEKIETEAKKPEVVAKLPTTMTAQTINEIEITSSPVQTDLEIPSGQKESEDLKTTVDTQKLETPSIILEAPVAGEKLGDDSIKPEEKPEVISETVKPIAEDEEKTEKIPDAADKSPSMTPESTSSASTIEQEVSEIVDLLPESINSLVDELISDGSSDALKEVMEDKVTSKDPEVPVDQKTPEAMNTQEKTDLKDSGEKTEDSNPSVTKKPESSDGASTIPETGDEPVFQRLPEIEPGSTSMNAEAEVAGPVENGPQTIEAVPESTEIVTEETVVADKNEPTQNLIPAIEVDAPVTSGTDNFPDKNDGLDTETTQATVEKKPETLLTELADSVSSMISQVSEIMPSMVPIPQKTDTNEQSIKRVEDGVKQESSTVRIEVLPIMSEEEKEVKKPAVADEITPSKIEQEMKKPEEPAEEMIMVEVKIPEPTVASSVPEVSEAVSTGPPESSGTDLKSPEIEATSESSNDVQKTQTVVANEEKTEQAGVPPAEFDSMKISSSGSNTEPVKTEEIVILKPENLKPEKIEVILKEGNKTEVFDFDAEAPIVRIDITEAKPTSSGVKNDESTESSVVRIQLTNPVETINQMIDSAPEVATPVEVQEILLPEKNVLEATSPQNTASSLIAGNQPSNSIEAIEKQEDFTPQLETAASTATSQIIQDPSPTESLITDSGSKTAVETITEVSNADKPQVEIEMAKIPEAQVTQATIERKPEVNDEENKKSPISETGVSKTEESVKTKLEEPVEIEKLKDSIVPVVQVEPADTEVEKIESSTQSQEEKKPMETTEKIVEPVTIVSEEKIKQTDAPRPVEDTLKVVPQEVVVSTTVDVQPTEVSVEKIEDDVAQPLKDAEKAEEIITKVEKPEETNMKIETPEDMNENIKKPEQMDVKIEKPEETTVKIENPEEANEKIVKTEEMNKKVEKPEEMTVKIEKPEEANEKIVKTEEMNKKVEKPEETTVKVEKPEEMKEKIVKPEEMVVKIEKPEEMKEKIVKPEEMVVKIEKPEEMNEKIVKPEEMIVKIEKPEEMKEKIVKPEEMIVKIEKPEEIKEKIVKPEETTVKIEKPEEMSEKIKKPEETNMKIEKPEETNMKIEKPEEVNEKIEKLESSVTLEKNSDSDAEKSVMKIDDTRNESTQNVLPVELSTPAAMQPDVQPSINVLDNSTPAAVVIEDKKTDKPEAQEEVNVPVTAQTDSEIQNIESSEKKTESPDVKNELPTAVEKEDLKVSTVQVKPETEKTEESTSPSNENQPEKIVPSDDKESSVPDVVLKDQPSVPLVRIDVSPEKNQLETSTTKIAEIPVAMETDVKKKEKPETPESAGINLPESGENLKQTEKPEAQSVQMETTTGDLESSSKAPEKAAVQETEVQMPAAKEPEIVVKTTEESMKETVEKVDAKLPEASVETTSKIESEETAKPLVRIDTTSHTAPNDAPTKTQEIRIQVNDTAVLVTKQKIPQKVQSDEKKVQPAEIPDSKIDKIEVSSQPPEKIAVPSQPSKKVEVPSKPLKVPGMETPVTIASSQQTDKTTSKQDLDKVKIESTTEKRKPGVDPYVKLGEKKPEKKPEDGNILKTPNPSNKKPLNTGINKDTGEKWTLIPQSEPYPVIKQQVKPSAEVPPSTNKNGDVSVPLEAHHSAVSLDESTRDQDEDISQFSKLCNELAFSFWISANKGLSTARSLALSPFGMTSMLAMVFLGARGPTSGQMNDILKLDDVVTFNPHLVFQNVSDSVNLARGQGIANAAFVRELFADRIKAGRLLPFYKERAQQFYDGHVEEVNFATISDLVRRRTNLLIRRQTGGRIRDFVKGNVMPLRSPLAALSANVFQTDCTGASSEGRDGEMYFAVLPAVRQRKLVPVPATVWRSGVLAGYEPGLDATVISLGGVGNLVSTIFVLPGQQGLAAPGDSLDHLEKRLLEGAFTNGIWDRLLRVLIPRMGVEVQVPKFSHRSVVNATAALKRMGLDDLFSRHADLKGINGIGNDLHLADMLQINLFSTCGDEVITGGRHHVEIYPASPLRGARRDANTIELEKTEHAEEEEEEEVESLKISDVEIEEKRARRSLEVGEYVQQSNPEKILTVEKSEKKSMPAEERSQRSSNNSKELLQLSKGKQNERPLLKLDRPFLYFVRHNPTGMILHMGRFNPRLMP